MMAGTTYDTVVVGAGLGGLCAAASLAREGQRVLLVEGAPHPGGTAYTYLRGGFQFPMGPLGFSSPARVKQLWEGLTGRELSLRRVDYLLRLYGAEVLMSSGYPRLLEQLDAAFPEGSRGAGEFLRQVRMVAEALRRPEGPAALSLSARAASRPASEYLRPLVGDHRLRRILGSQGCREPYSSMALLAAMWDLLCEQGIHYPEGGFRRFCDGLLEAFLQGKHGGELRLGTRAAGIAVERCRVRGVELKGSGLVEAGAVVCNADYKRTFLELVPPRDLPPAWLEGLRAAPLTSSNLQVALGLDARKVDLSLFDKASRIIFCPDEEDGGTRQESVGSRDAALREVELCLWSADDPGLAPPGAAALVIRTSAPYSLFLPYHAGRGSRARGYAELKRRFLLRLTAAASRLLPGLEDAVLFSDAATPLTFADRGGRSEGAVAGWSWDFRGEAPTARELVLTPVAGLYMAGHQAFTSLLEGGVPSALLSGRRAAAAVLGGEPPIKPRDFPIPAPQGSRDRVN
jgi:all-trans-retinol 13,14-reductase